MARLAAHRAAAAAAACQQCLLLLACTGSAVAPKPAAAAHHTYADNHLANVESLQHLVNEAGAGQPPGFPFKWKCRVTAVAAAPGPPPAVPLGPLPGLPSRTEWTLGTSSVFSNGTEW